MLVVMLLHMNRHFNVTSYFLVSFRPRASNDDGESRSLPSSSSSSSTPPPAFEEVLRSGPSDKLRNHSAIQSGVVGKLSSSNSAPRRERHSEGIGSKSLSSQAEAIR